MKVRRFQVDRLAEGIVRVEGGEADHALRVLHLKVGDTLRLFDGRGHEAQAVIRAAGPHHFDAELLEWRQESRIAAPRLIVAAATPKGERADWMVEKAAELGVSALWLVQWRRGEVHPGEGKIARWRRKAVQAAKQAGSSQTMTVESPRSLPLIVDALPPRSRVWCATPDAVVAFAASLQSAGSAALLDLEEVIFIGPEGGFTADERQELRRVGAREVRLCDSILRVETAVVASAAVWGAWVLEYLPPSPHAGPGE